MIFREDLLFILVFWSFGYFIFIKKDRIKEQDTLFDRQHWEVWTGILAVSILIFLPSLSTKILSLFRLEFNPIYYFLLKIFSLFSIVLLYHFSTRQPVRLLGFSVERITLRLIFGSKWAFGVLFIGGVLGYFLLQISLVSRALAAQIIQAQQQGIIHALINLFESQLGAWSLWMPILLIVILAPLVEELVFRGMLYSPIRKRFGPPKAMLITGFLFSIFHRVPEMRPMMAFFLAGILYAYIYEQTESLMPVILAHSIQNLSTVLNYFNYRAVKSIADLKSEYGWTAFLLTSIFLTLEVIYRMMLKRGYTLTGIAGKISREPCLKGED